MANTAKYLSYKYAFERMKTAVARGFHLEAVVIAESVISDRLHSATGTMAISETSVRDATLMAIDEINAAGGVMGKKLVPVIEDGASDWPTFAEKAKKLITSDKVAVVFG